MILGIFLSPFSRFVLLSVFMYIIVYPLYVYRVSRTRRIQYNEHGVAFSTLVSAEQ